MSMAISAVSSVSSASGTAPVSGTSATYEKIFANLKPENATAQDSITQVNDIFDKMEQSNISKQPFFAEMLQKDKSQRDYMRMTESMRKQMIDGMREIFTKRTDEATGMYKTAVITKMFSKVTQGITQLSSAQ